MNWPRDNQADLIRFYGKPGKGGTVEKQLIRVVPPWQMYYGTQKIKSFSFHQKAAPALIRVLNRIWEAYGRDQNAIENIGLHRFAGTYNPRKVRGSSTKWSNHAFGAAIDFNAEENAMGSRGNMPADVVQFFADEGARWGGNYTSRKDPMHFEFCCGVMRTAEADASDEEGDVLAGIQFDDATDDTSAPSVTFSAKSKKIAAATVVGAGAGGAAVDTATQNTDFSWLDQVTNILHYIPSRPSFWFLIAIAAVGGYFLYKEWHK